MDATVYLTKIMPVEGNTITLEGNLSDVLVVNTSTGVVEAKGLAVVDDHGAGIVGTTMITNVVDTSLSTGTGAIKLKGTGTSQNSSGWLKIYIGTQVVYIPYFTDITGS